MRIAIQKNVSIECVTIRESMNEGILDGFIKHEQFIARHTIMS